VKAQVTELRADPASSWRSGWRPAEVSASLDFAVSTLGESHGCHGKGKLPTSAITEGSLEPNLLWLGIKTLGK